MNFPALHGSPTDCVVTERHRVALDVGTESYMGPNDWLTDVREAGSHSNVYRPVRQITHGVMLGKLY